MLLALAESVGREATMSLRPAAAWRATRRQMAMPAASAKLLASLNRDSAMTPQHPLRKRDDRRRAAPRPRLSCPPTKPIAALTVESTSTGGGEHAEAASGASSVRQETGSRRQAAPGHPRSQPFPRPPQSHADRGDRAAQANRRVLISQPLQVAKHDRHAILFGQPRDLLMEGLELLAADQRQVWPVAFGRPVQHRIAAGDRTFTPLPAIFPHPRLPRRSKSHAVQPMPQKLRLLDRAGPSRQDQERGLEGIFRRMPIDQDLPADPEDHRPVTTNQGREGSLRGLVAIGRESRQ